MTLAAILLFSFLSTSYAVSGSVLLPETAQQADTAQSPSAGATQDQGGTGSQTPAEAAPPAASAAKPKAATRKSATGKKPVKNNPAHKKATDPGCESVTADPAKGVGSAAASQTSPQDASATQAAPQPPKNCPPEKIVVRQGGTAEQSIQLAGGDQESQKKKDANQMLGSTEENLKKISGIQLSAEQQDTVSQIKQFVDQSKAALAAGDLERGHTLAWKAQLLSEDLTKPQK